MRAIVIEQLGVPMQVHRDHPAPDMLPGHVRVQIVAASVNFADTLMVQGGYQVKPKLPFVPGSELSGIVTEVGPGVKRIKVGDKVCAFHTGGAFAEEAIVPEAVTFAVPDGVPLDAAAGIPVAYGTSDVALRHRARLQPDHTVLVLGASGGVGVAAVQIAKLVGAHVIAVATGAAKAAFLRGQGADVVIDAATATKEVPLHKLIKAAAPKGVNVVYDPVGGAMFTEALKTCAWGAQYLVIGFAAGVPKVPANVLLVKNVTLHGVFWGSYLATQPEVLQDSLQQLMAWFAAGRLRVEVSHRFPLEAANEAFAALLTRQVQGKVLVVMQPQARL